MSRTPPPAGRGDPIRERALALHERALVVDLHNDFLLKAALFGRDFAARGRGPFVYTPFWTDLDLPRCREGGVDALGFALWAGRRGPQFEQVSRLLDRLDAILAANPVDVSLATTAAEIEAAAAAGKLAAFVGIEGGQAIEDDLEKLRALHRRGARYMSLTWNTSPSWARGSGERRRLPADGLSAFGRDVVREMNALGMLVDVAHASERTFWEIVETSRRPVFDSHAGCWAIKNHHRNLKDDQIRAIAKAGGVVGVIFCTTFLGRFRADLTVVAEHIEHLMKIGGEEVVALGSDFDGFVPLPAGLRDVRDLPKLTELLLRRGHAESTVENLLGRNFLRTFERAAVRHSGSIDIPSV